MDADGYLKGGESAGKLHPRAREHRLTVEGDRKPHALEGVGALAMLDDPEPHEVKLFGSHEDAGEKGRSRGTMRHRREHYVRGGLALRRLGAFHEVPERLLSAEAALLSDLTAEADAGLGIGRWESAETESLPREGSDKTDLRYVVGILHADDGVGEEMRTHRVDLKPLDRLAVRKGTPRAAARRVYHVAWIEPDGRIACKGARRGKRRAHGAAEDARERADLLQLHAGQAVAGRR